MATGRERLTNYWVSQLAEELAVLAEVGDAAGLSLRVKAAAEQYGYAPWTVVHMIAAEWDRLGLVKRTTMSAFIRA